MKAHSCNKESAESADMKTPAALQTSNSAQYFTPASREIERWPVKGERIEKAKAMIINMAFDFIELYFSVLTRPCQAEILITKSAGHRNVKSGFSLNAAVQNQK